MSVLRQICAHGDSGGGMGIKEAISELEKRFGKGIGYRLGDETRGTKYLKTGSLVLDRCIGGGFPVGRIVELYGPEGSGKTSLALHAIREAQRVGVICGYVDMEHAVDIEFAKRIGVEVGELNFAQPDYGEMALEVVMGLVGECGLIVVDSVATLTPKAEIDGDMGDVHMGLQARLMSQAMRKLGPKCSGEGCCLVFINQIRMRIGGYGSPETTSGGLALKFHAWVRVDLRRRMGEKDMLEGGHRIEFKVVKNRVGPPFRSGKSDFYYEFGLDNVGELLGLAIQDGVVILKGNSYFYGEERLGTGREQAVRGLKGFYEEVLEKISKN